MEEREDEEVGSEEKMAILGQECVRVLQHKELEKTTASQYSGSAQVGGYFDCDETVGLDVHLFTLGLDLELTDNWFAQVTMLKNFFDKSGVKMSYNYEHGRKIALEFTGRLAAKAIKVEAPAETQRSIVRDYQVFNPSQDKLADTFGLSRTVVRRILGVN